MTNRPRESSKGRLVEVAILSKVERTFTYIVGDELADTELDYRRVLVPLGRRLVTGMVIGPGVPVAEVTMKEVRDVLDPEPLITPELLELARFAASYYVAPLGEVLRTMLPPGVNVESYRALELTELGRAAMHNAPDKLERALLALASRGPRSAQSLIKAVHGARHRHLLQMQRQGWIEPIERLKPSVRPRSARVVTLSAEGAELDVEQLVHRAPRQAAVLAALAGGGGRIFAAELARIIGPCAASLRTLRDKGLIEFHNEDAPRGPEACADLAADEPAQLSDEQQMALDQLEPALEKREFRPCLLRGVTGSGKTEIYVRLTQRALELGLSACVIVPEISLTPQLVSRFACRIEGQIAVLHSGLTPSERLASWRSILSGKVRLVIGARSALFAPLRDLGLVVVDEEHETSFKQEDGVAYNARDLALVAARQAGALAVLGSATPSLESLYNVQRGKLEPFVLSKRIDDRPLPEIRVIDMQGRPPDPQGAAPALSDELIAGLENTLRAGRQSILFINRRGSAGFVLCAQCGHVPSCRNCSISLVLHRSTSRLHCHYCDQVQDAPTKCPQCGGTQFVFGPPGTQSVQQQVEELFPKARVLRLDRDTTRGRAGYERALGSFARGEHDVMIGTQMVAKGHDFPNVTLVGVLLADQSLALPDFRAAERTYSQLVQVSGRAGRGDDAGLVLWQTYAPEHYAIKAAAAHDLIGLLDCELQMRREADYPPFGRLALVRLSATSPIKAADYANALAEIARVLARRSAGWIDVLGPAPALVSKVRGRYRWQVLLRGRGTKALSPFVSQLLRRAAKSIKISGVRIQPDVDPISMF
ncbi:MAG: primosomal protein N' [Candidatus Alcyoniella australis]|nr:primosomal protein N' [Candidatus Alcyoniella australis]